MTRLEPSGYLAHLLDDSARFREVLTDVDPAARVPACPDWDADDLLWHLTEVQWFWATRMRLRPAPPAAEPAPPTRPDSHAGLLDLFDECSTALTRELAGADPAEPAWSWAAEQTVGFTFRRQAHEALIHRLDAEQTAGLSSHLDPALAADGVAEVLDVMYGGEPPAWAAFEPHAGHVRLDLTDVDVALWATPGTLTGTDPDTGEDHSGPHLLRVDDPGLEPAAVIVGTAADLDTWLWRRSDASLIERSGDDVVLAAFLAAIDFPLD